MAKEKAQKDVQQEGESDWDYAARRAALSSDGAHSTVRNVTRENEQGDSVPGAVEERGAA